MSPNAHAAAKEMEQTILSRETLDRIANERSEERSREAAIVWWWVFAILLTEASVGITLIIKWWLG